MDYNKLRQMYKKYSKIERDKKNLIEELNSLNKERQKLLEMFEEKKNESEKLRQINKQNIENFEKYKKEQVEEVEKFKKRVEKEKDEIIIREKRKFLIDFIELLGHFEYAMDSITDKNIKKGIEMVYNEFIKTLQKHGVEIIEEENVPFDSNIHHAIGIEKREGVKKNMVLKIVRKGFKLGNRIIRPADCIVSN